MARAIEPPIYDIAKYVPLSTQLSSSTSLSALYALFAIFYQLAPPVYYFYIWYIKYIVAHLAYNFAI
jgi:hypothetical protein